MVDDLSDTYGDAFIPVFCHLGGEAGSGGAAARANFYDLQYTPYLWLNGADDAGYDYVDWTGDLVAHLGQETDVTIRIVTSTEGPILSVSATVCIEEMGVDRALRVFIAQVLDHFPDSSGYYRNALRQVQDVDIAVQGGHCVDVDTMMVLPPLPGSSYSGCSRKFFIRSSMYGRKMTVFRNPGY